MILHEYPDGWGLVYGSEEDFVDLVEVMVDEGVVAVWGRAKKRSRWELVELYFLQPFFSCPAETGLWQRGTRVELDPRRREQSLEERVRIRRPGADGRQAEIPAAVVSCPRPRAGRRTLRYPPAQWQARVLPVMVMVKGADEEQLQRLRGGLSVPYALEIVQAVLDWGIGISGGSMMTRLYGVHDYLQRRIAVDHLAKVFEGEARGDEVALVVDYEPLVVLSSPTLWETDFRGLFVLSLVIKTWRGRINVLGLPPAGHLAQLLAYSLNLFSPLVHLRVYPAMVVPGDLPELLSLLPWELGGWVQLGQLRALGQRSQMGGGEQRLKVCPGCGQPLVRKGAGLANLWVCPECADWVYDAGGVIVGRCLAEESTRSGNGQSLDRPGGDAGAIHSE